MSYLGEQTALAAFVVATVVAIVAAVIDLRRFRIPNALTFPLCLSGMLFHSLMGGVSGLQYSVGGIVIGIVALLLFYIMGVMGAGDVKLLAACGAWIGAANTVYVFCAAGIVTGIHSLAMLAWQRRLRDVPVIFQVALMQMMTLGRHLAASESVGEVVQQVDRRRYVVPFGVMIAIGLLLVVVKEFGMQAWK